MNNEQLRDKFLQYANDLKNSPDPSAKYRINAYNRVAAKLETLDLKENASIESIKSLELSEFMNAKALSFMKESRDSSRTKSKSNSNSKSPAAKKTRDSSESRNTSKSKSPVAKKTRGRSKTRSRSPAVKKTFVDTAKLIKELSEFMGLGPEKAKDLIDAGLKNINQLHMKKYKQLLPEETKLFLDLKPLQTIPREHIQALEPFLMKASHAELELTITGSYRRGKTHSSDIDLMVVSDDSNAIQILLDRLSEILNGKVYPYSKGSDKMSLIVDMTDILTSTDGDKKVYKIDAFRTSVAAKIPMLLYSTGSKEFNVIMRSKAKKLGYLLNQKGLFKNGELVPNLNSEKDYFDILNMSYKEPNERI